MKLRYFAIGKDKQFSYSKYLKVRLMNFVVFCIISENLT